MFLQVRIGGVDNLEEKVSPAHLLQGRAEGGDELVRREALVQVGGFDAELKAGEEPELCARLRRAGILRGSASTNCCVYGCCGSAKIASGSAVSTISP